MRVILHRITQTVAMPAASIFDQYSEEYDGWFDRHEAVYRAEITALKRFTPLTGRGLEVGVGTGRFAVPLAIQFGIDPSLNMVRRVASRGIKVCAAYGERLPFPPDTFDFVVLVTVDCFVEDLHVLFGEAHRVLRPHGRIIIGHIDRHSPLGQRYESRKATDKFYRDAHFRSADEIIEALKQVGFEKLRFCQTILGIPGEAPDATQVIDGYGSGGFVVISAEKSIQGD